MNSTLNRRAALTALATGAAVALVPAAAMASPTPAGIRPEFLEAERLFLRLEERAAIYDRTVHDPAHKRSLAARAALPHTSVTFNDATWTTANESDVRVARHVGDCFGEFRRDQEVIAARRLVAAHLRRERAAKRLPELAELKATCAESNRLSDLSSAAEDAFFAMRTTSLAELAHKLRIMAERQRDYEGCVAEIVLPDVLAIASREA